MATAASSSLQKLIKSGTKIVAIGRNYAAHAKELGNAVPKEPVVFLKPTSSYLENGGTIEVPQPLEALDHEVELAVVIGQKARDVPQVTAMDYVGGYALALDMTAREIQSVAKSSGLPWTVAKGQDTFTPISSVLSKSTVPDPDNLELWLKVDGETRQQGSTKDMIFKIPYLISHISSIMTLFEGDVILTGTPQGVGPVKVGQKVTAGITGLLDIHFDVGRRQRLDHIFYLLKFCEMAKLEQIGDIQPPVQLDLELEQQEEEDPTPTQLMPWLTRQHSIEIHTYIG